VSRLANPCRSSTQFRTRWIGQGRDVISTGPKIRWRLTGRFPDSSFHPEVVVADHVPGCFIAVAAVFRVAVGTLQGVISKHAEEVFR